MLKIDWLKVLGLAKKNWKEIIIIILLLTVIGKMHYDYRQLETAYETSQESLQNQIEGLQAIHTEELQKKEDALRVYRESFQLERQNFQIRLDSLLKEYGLRITEKDREIAALQEALLAQAPTRKWLWFAGGVATGIGATYVAYRGFNE